MKTRELLELRERILAALISLHKRVDVGALSDAEWREYQVERRRMEDALKKTK